MVMGAPAGPAGMAAGSVLGGAVGGGIKNAIIGEDQSLKGYAKEAGRERGWKG